LRDDLIALVGDSSNAGLLVVQFDANFGLPSQADGGGEWLMSISLHLLDERG
jgi:hypothetical protein